LKQALVDAGDVDLYLDIIEDRVRSGQTGSQWMLKSLAALNDSNESNDVLTRALTKASLVREKEGKPVHLWELAETTELGDWWQSYQTVGQYMSTDLFTLRPNDLVDLAASVMDWRHIRHVPVEDDDGRLVGLVTHRGLLRVMNRGSASREGKPLTVREIMKANPTSVSSATPSLEAIEIMRVSKIGCLPVVDDGQLVGIVTSYDFLTATARLFKQQLGATALRPKVTNIKTRRAGANGDAA
jgi:CBS domain-containing protein